MKYLIQFLLIISIVLLASCGSSISTKTATNPHVDEHKKMHDEFIKEQMMQDVENTENQETFSGYQKILQEKFAAGIDFYAIGNEPFWNLSIDLQKNISFNQMGETDLILPVSTPVKIDKSRIKYHSKGKMGEVIIRLNKSKCIDNMSGQEFTHSVIVEVKKSNNGEFSTLNGCGNYVPDFRLHNIWAVIKIKGEKLNSKDFKNGLPRIEFNMNKNKIMGFDGCNHFNGSFEFEPGKLNIGPLMSTMMACEDNKKITNKFNQILTNKDLTYKFTNQNLEIYLNKNKVLVLRNVD